MTNHTVTVIRDEDLWVAKIGGLPENVVGAVGYVYFSEVKEVPEVIADLTRSGPDEFTITWRYEFGAEDVTEEIADLLAECADARAKVLEAMHGAGLSQRAMADVVGLSYQRVQQLLNTGHVPVPRVRHRRGRLPAV